MNKTPPWSSKEEVEQRLKEKIGIEVLKFKMTLAETELLLAKQNQKTIERAIEESIRKAKEDTRRKKAKEESKRKAREETRRKARQGKEVAAPLWHKL